MLVDDNEFRESIVCASLNESIVVQAGPGSGKTTMLVERLNYIIANRTKSFSGIACITYTNAAKEEIISRLQNKGVQLPNELFIGTIHSFLLENLIKPYSHFFNRDKVPYRVAAPGFSRKYKREIGQMLNQPTHFINDRLLGSFESLGRDEGGSPCCYSNKISPEIALEWKKFILGEGYIDQQEIIYLSYCILNKYDHIRDALSARFPYILIDEYQDVTFYQEKFFSLLAHSYFFCVGDNNQSIYSFTGAKPEIFKQKWGNRNYKSYTLSNNFRSTEHIVKFANLKTEIIQVEAGKNASSEQKVVFIKNISEASEAIQLFHHIRKDIDYDNQYKPYMILTRQNDYMKEINNILKERDGELNKFLEKLKFENHRCFKILKNLLLAIFYKRKNNFDKAIEKIGEAFNYVFFNENTPHIALSEIEYNMFMWKKIQIFTLHFLDGLALSEVSVASLFVKIKEFVGYSSKSMYNKSIGNKMKILNYKWKNQAKKSKTTMISELIDEIKLQEDMINNEGYILNIHTAKGQEAECTLIMAQSEQQLTKWLDRNDSSEEARVGYVAFSRARKLLCVWAPLIQEENYIHLKKHVQFISKFHETQVKTSTLL